MNKRFSEYFERPIFIARNVQPRVKSHALALEYSYKRRLGRELTAGGAQGSARLDALPGRATTEVLVKLGPGVEVRLDGG